VPKKRKLHKNELNTTFFCSTSPSKGSKGLKIFKISLTFRFDKSVHTGENSQILTVSNKKKYFSFHLELSKIFPEIFYVSMIITINVAFSLNSRFMNAIFIINYSSKKIFTFIKVEIF
jgi:hypothetical protein